MADLFDRLFLGDGGSGIPVHAFRAAVGDYAAGHTVRAEIVAYWNLDSEAQADLNILCTAIDEKTSLAKVAFLLELHDVLMIAEVGAKYTTKAEFRARLEL